MENNTRLPGSLQLWNKECFGNIFRRKIRLRARLEGIQKQLCSNHSDHLLKLEKKTPSGTRNGPQLGSIVVVSEI